MRVFIAIEVPAEASQPYASPRAPEHLTLRFLGEVPSAAVAPVAAALEREVSPRPAFSIVIEGVGAFPSPDQPRVVWRGIGEGREAIESLARAVRSAVVAAGLADDPTPFVPHLTLFRVRSARDRARAEALLRGTLTPPSPRRVPVVAVDLKSSVLGPRGVTHQTLARIPLAAPAQ